MNKTLLFFRSVKKLYAVWPILILCILITTQVHGQVDYYYGRNMKGFRVAVGAGLNVLENKFQVNPTKESYTFNIDYNVNRFLSYGIEGQTGTLMAQNKFTPGLPHQPFSPITNKYNAVNFNIKVSYGLIRDYDATNVLTDILKDLYVGAGVGFIKSNVTLISAYLPTPDVIIQKPNDVAVVFPVNIGINVDLPRIRGKDVLSVNPNFQVDVVGDKYLEGFSSSFTKIPVSLYNLFTVSLKYKF